MPRPRTVLPFGAILFCTGLAACGTANPVRYTGLASSPKLMPNVQDTSGRVPYRYATTVDWRTYDKVILEPVTIYQGKDQQFVGLSDADKATLADYMQTRFAAALQKRFTSTEAPGPNTLRVKLTLAGATANVPLIGALTRLNIAGALYNGVQSVRDREGSLTGAVIYAVEIFDAGSGQLLAAQVNKQYPAPYDLPASFTPLAASQAGVDLGVKALLEQLQ